DGSFVDGAFEQFPVGPHDDHHLRTLSGGNSNGITLKVPQLRTLYGKTGFDMQGTDNTGGFGYLHDGRIDTLARGVSEPIFVPRNDAEVADGVSFLLFLAGSDLPGGDPPDPQHLPGVASNDPHAAVGLSTTLVDGKHPRPEQPPLISTAITLAD